MAEHLLTVAELCLVLLGFSGVVVVFLWRDRVHRAQFFRFWMLVSFSLGGLVCALLPFGLMGFGLSEADALSSFPGSRGRSPPPHSRLEAMTSARASILLAES